MKAFKKESIIMSILISRNTGVLGSGTRIQIRINGKKMASIKENSNMELELPDDKAYLKVTQLGLKSDTVAIKESDVIKITLKKGYKALSIAIIITFVLSIFAPILSNEIALVFFFFWLLMIVFTFLSHPIHLNISNRKN